MLYWKLRSHLLRVTPLLSALQVIVIAEDIGARFRQKRRLGCTQFESEVYTLPHQCLSRLHTSALDYMHPGRCFCLNRAHWRYKKTHWYPCIQKRELHVTFILHFYFLTVSMHLKGSCAKTICPPELDMFIIYRKVLCA